MFYLSTELNILQYIAQIIKLSKIDFSFDTVCIRILVVVADNLSIFCVLLVITSLDVVIRFRPISLLLSHDCFVAVFGSEMLSTDSAHRVHFTKNVAQNYPFS